MRKNIKLLLIDDNLTTRKHVARILTDAGYAVTVAGSTDYSIHISGKAAFDLAIVEICLSDLSGIDLASELLSSGISFMLLCNSHQPSALDDKATPLPDEALAESISPIDILAAVDASLSQAIEFKRLQETESRYMQAIETGRFVDVVVGILMERHHLEREHAFEMLRSKARSERKKLRELAQEILDALDKINKLSP